MLYLIEPLFAFFAAAALFLLYQPQSMDVPVRLVELHAQDVLSVMQAGGTFEELLSGNGTGKTDMLVRALNPNYGWQAEISGGGQAKKIGVDQEGDKVSVSRNFVHGGEFFTIKLNIYYRHS